jgi:hypothetical protein
MAIPQLTSEAMALPLSERVSLAQALWQSIGHSVEDAGEKGALSDSIARDQEISSGAVICQSHEEVMRAARQAIACV